MNNDTDLYTDTWKQEPDRLAEQPERQDFSQLSRQGRKHPQKVQDRKTIQKDPGKKGSSAGRAFKSFVLTILLVLFVFILAFSATFYARSRGWLKGKAPADSTVIRRMFEAL